MTNFLPPARRKSNIWRLSLAQALSGANGVVVYATGAIIGNELAPAPVLATLPVTIFVIGMALSILPAGKVSRRFGRKRAFLLGAAAGGGIGAARRMGVCVGNILAALFGGIYAAVVLGFRFAATDGVEESHRARALSLVMAGGVAAGVFGPQLVNGTMYRFEPVYLATFYLQALVALLSAWVLSGLQLPPLESRAPHVAVLPPRSLRQIFMQPLFPVAVLTGAVSYLLMNFLMTAAPLAMHLHGHSREAANISLQWHVIAMYAPSFFTGSLIDRFGARRISFIGLLLTGLSIVIALGGMEVVHFRWFLILLGAGWNFGFLGASALVLRCHEVHEKTQVQSLNDFIIFSLMAVGSFASGSLLNACGWNTILWLSLLPLSLAVLALAAVGRTA